VIQSEPREMMKTANGAWDLFVNGLQQFEREERDKHYCKVIINIIIIMGT
jgi:hypothetical protein